MKRPVPSRHEQLQPAWGGNAANSRWVKDQINRAGRSEVCHLDYYAR